MNQLDWDGAMVNKVACDICLSLYMNDGRCPSISINAPTYPNISRQDNATPPPPLPTHKPNPSQPLLLLLLPRFGRLLPPLNHTLGAHTAKHQADTHPLHRAQPVPKPQHAEHHGEHLARHGDGDEKQAGEMAEGVIYEDLAYGSASCEAEDVLANGWVLPDESEGGGELVCGGGGD